MPYTRAGHKGPQIKAVMASMAMMNVSRVAYLESALLYSFPAHILNRYHCQYVYVMI